MLENADAIQDAVIKMDPSVQKLLSVSLAFTMLTVALGLKPEDFRFIKEHPQSVVIGSLAQLLALPVVTLGLIYLITPEAGIALGMLIAAACPGGTISNLLTRIAGGDAAYSVSLTMVSSIFSTAALPFAILFWTGLYGPTSTLLDTINIDRVEFIIGTSITLLIPLALGLTISHHKPALAAKMNRYFLPVAIGILVFLIVSGLVNNSDLILKYGSTIYPIVIGHNALAFLVGFSIGKFTLKSVRKVRALTFEVGIQNTGLGLLIVLTQMGGVGSTALIVGTWSIWHLFAGFLLASSFRLSDRINAAKHQAAE
ncbi:bile acid:sodium symporter family protein [Kordiimonas sp. SCSIO 12603]|uniref:bile acid:sodium symporter family protein n=1 Tax=Kordiimonas sp. SCSIO 12603 TaxID=2829596 RepID=UPI00210236E6|nr:bile acid:sodium symporter [Kordiimonas sp. SCSIO 12603]UTW58278.1 bile acid:sodium symporter family protein [Kordiimonas sp. SCSIO 12603]